MVRKSHPRKAKAKTVPLEEEGEHQQQQIHASANNDEEEKKLEDLKLVASLTDWTNCERKFGKLFYEKFGLNLEQQMEVYENNKQELKEFVRNIFGDKKALKTPKTSKKPASVILDQINFCRQLNFESDEDTEDSNMVEENTIVHVPSPTHQQLQEENVHVPVSIHQHREEAQQQDEQGTSTQNVPQQRAPTQYDEVTAGVDDVDVVMATPELNNATQIISRANVAIPVSSAIDNNLQVHQTTPHFPAPATPSTTPKSVVPSTPQSPPVRKMGGTPSFIGIKPLSNSMRKLALAKSIEKSGHRPMHLPPIVPDLSAMRDPKAAGTSISTPKQALNNTFQKQQKLKQLDEKAVMANKMREDQLKEKAERAKKEREERQKLVEKNKRRQEQQRLEMEEHARTKEAQMKKFAEEQKRQQHLQAQQAQAAASPFRSPAAKKPMTRNQTAQKAAAALLTVNNNKAGNSSKAPTAAAPKQAKKPVNTSKTAAAAISTKAKVKEFVDETPPTLTMEAVGTSSKSNNNSQQNGGGDPHRKKRTMDQENEPPLGPMPPSPPISPILSKDDHGGGFDPSIEEIDEGEEEEDSVYDMTKEKVHLPSTEENYNVDDLSSGDETDNDENPRKTVPRWAQAKGLERQVRAIRRLVTVDQLERYFGRIRQPEINDLFKGYRTQQRQRRASSATWNSPMSDPTPGVGHFQHQFQSSSSG